ncbi:MAG: hypothetical protein EOP18_08230 [Rhizobiaceae bacterium]|nr:MAG: hypothetical protein EOP18_08230 [Rhizobiaceae bacterium]
MAYLQSEVPPSKAPVAPARTARVIARSKLRPDHSVLIARLIFALMVTAALAVLGIAAARATESFAIGVIAADLTFLIAVAGWSAVYGGTRR